MEPRGQGFKGSSEIHNYRMFKVRESCTRCGNLVAQVIENK